MDIISSVEKRITDWVFSIALKKAITRIAQFIVSFFATKGITIVVNGQGINFDSSNETAIASALLGVSEIVRNYLKTKYPAKFGWL